jgi:hypothetical protein
MKQTTIVREKEYLKDLLKKTILQIKRDLPLEDEFREILHRKLGYVSAYIESHGKIDTIEYKNFELRTVKGETYTLYVSYCPLEFIFLFKADMTYVVNKKTRKLALIDMRNMKISTYAYRRF